jgi:hypothetical protein
MVAVMLRPYGELVDFGYVFCNEYLFLGISLYAGWCATAGFDVNVRMWAIALPFSDRGDMAVMLRPYSNN